MAACLAGALGGERRRHRRVMDGDGADDPACIAALVAPICAGAFDFLRDRVARARASRQHRLAPASRRAGSPAPAPLLYGVRYRRCAPSGRSGATPLALGMREMTYG
jgi:hypothetical protein